MFYYNAELDKSRNPEKYESQKRFFNKLKQIPDFNLKLCKLLKRKIKGTKNIIMFSKKMISICLLIWLMELLMISLI